MNHEGRVSQVANTSSNTIDVVAAAGTSKVGKAVAAGVEQEIWPEPDLAGFPKNGWIPDLPELKYATTLMSPVAGCTFINILRTL